ncbi:MAG: peptidase M50 [Alicyclobacillaceae bacterium]|nr:peptidase M50 [Alicyclobacillaceae bacterium]
MVQAARPGLLRRVRVHPLFAALVVLAAAAGLWLPVVVLFLIVFLHELAHAAVADALGCTVEEVTLLPFGGVAKLSFGDGGFIPRREAAIAIAGPAVNFVLAAVAWCLQVLGIWSVDFGHAVVEINLWMAVFNLLPGLPLDGGRVLRAARSRQVGFERATREGYRMALWIAFALLLTAGAAMWSGYPHLGMLVLGVFLLTTAWSGRRGVSMELVRFLDAKRRAAGGRAQVVRALAAPEQATVRDAVMEFAPDRYHMVYVLDEHGQVRDILEEGELLQAVFEGRWLDRLDSWRHGG